MDLHSIVDALSILTLVGDIIIILIVLVKIISLFTDKSDSLVSWISTYALTFMLIIAVIATGGSLFLSEILNWAPCKLCWIQRIFMYPQVILLSIALWNKDKKISTYILALCIFGIVFSAFHYSEQLKEALWPNPIDPLVPCDDTGVSCAKSYTFRFGYITIPMMALTAFILNAIGSISIMRSNAKH